MKKTVGILLVAVLLLSCIVAAPNTVYASKKAEQTRAIGIVFDNSGSMYIEGEQAWCRATYAMEVFASMLNKGDTLQIYPMHPITVGGNEYTMNTPFTVTDAAQASAIRDIFTKNASGTPIESVDAAVNGVTALTADKKYVIVLTDGDCFYKNNVAMSAAETKKQLDTRFKAHAGEAMTMMYLGIGKEVVMPDTAESKFFTKKQAKNSADTLSALTEMCNQIFGRDTMPKSHITSNTLKLDISISKLIVFVQGENVTDLSVTGGSGAVGKLESTASTKYGTAGCGNYKSVPDKSLQGMMVTYTDCPVGNYKINYKGTATNIEVYYEPDADLDFVFTDAEGNLVDPNSLYEGDYKVSFGMKDAKTGQLISSDLLGNPHYEGSYFINDKEYPFSHDGNSGEVPVTLSMDDKFDADLTVTYLSGYTITKDSSDFGWPEGGIKVAPRPAGDLKLKLTGGDKFYSLEDLEKGKAYTAEVFYQGQKLTGKDLESVKLKWNPETSYAEIKQQFAEDHYKLTLHYKDAKAPANTACGKCKVAIHATYTAKGSDESKTQATLNYEIKDDFVPVKVELFAPEDYIVISDLDKSEAVVAKITANGKPLSAEDFKAVTLEVDCGGIKHKVTKNDKDGTFLIKLLDTKGIKQDDYKIKATAKYVDHIARETTSEDELVVTLSNMPLWLKWLIGILIAIALFFAVWKISHIRVLPARVEHKRDERSVTEMGKDVTQSTIPKTTFGGQQLTVRTNYLGNNSGVIITRLTPGDDSYLYKKSHKRNMVVSPQNVRTLGDVQYLEIDGVTFKPDRNTGRIMPTDEDQKPFKIRENATIIYDAKRDDNGRDRKFRVETKLTFKKIK